MSSFNDLGLSNELLRGVFAYGYEQPSKIQQDAIPHIATGVDTLIQAPSGTGKTGAFGMGLLVHLARTKHSALVLCHTRELALQTGSVLTELSAYEKKISVIVCCGGLNSAKQNLAELMRCESFIMVATPGRCVDLLREQRAPSIAGAIAHVVLDEADHLLQESFQEAVRDVLGVVSREAAVCVCSATMPPEVLELATRFQKENAVHIREPDSKALVLQGITQYHIPCPELVHKLEAVERMYHSWSVTASIIFCSSRSRVDWVGDQMASRGFPVARIHGGLNPAERAAVMQEFRGGNARVLVATNLLARGIDVQAVQLVVLYDMISDPDTYLHAIGRCGRYGRKGVSVALINHSSDEPAMLDNMSAVFGVVPVQMPPDFSIAQMT